MAYLHNVFVQFVLDESVTGGIRYATWGLGIEASDWNLAAEKAAIRVHEANPNMLIIVGGIFTGGYLGAARFKPIRLPNQVIKFAFLRFSVLLTFL